MQKLGVLFMLLMINVVTCFAEEKSGTLEGLLVSKGDGNASIEFIADGSDKAVKYIPEWVGGNPKDGGGLKKETLEAIKKIPAPNRVMLKWKDEEHLRVVEIKLLEPEKKEGTTAGTVTIVKDSWFEIKTSVDGKTLMERFMPKWSGKGPNEGGGLDKELLKEIGTLKIGDTVSVNWTYDERKRVTKIIKVIKD